MCWDCSGDCMTVLELSCCEDMLGLCVCLLVVWLFGLFVLCCFNVFVLLSGLGWIGWECLGC